MNTKNVLVSFLAIACVLALVSVVSSDGTPIPGVDVNGLSVDGVFPIWEGHTTNNVPSLIAGDTITIKVYFTANFDDTDVTFEAEIEGEKEDTEAQTSPFDVIAGKTYVKSLSIEVPYELKDEKHDTANLHLELDGKDYKTDWDFELEIQRPSYNAVIKSVTVAQNIDAGETFPVNLVLKNMGYNDLDDLYVTVGIPALGIEKSGYFGDLVAVEECDDDCDDDETDTVSGRLYLEVPYEVEPGVYSLEVEVENDDTSESVVKQININNDFTNTVIVDNFRQTVAVGEDAEYSFLIVNPTDNLKVYRIVAESTGDVTTSISESVVAVTAGSSKVVKVFASAESEGEYEFTVDVFAGENFVESVTFSLSTSGDKDFTSNPVVVLTIVLAIIFIVLLIVLIVLIGRKPEKSEEFGESYY